MALDESKRKVIDLEVQQLDLNYKTLGAAIKVLQDLAETYSKDAKIMIRQYDYSDREYLGVFVMGPEPDDVFKRRMEYEAWYTTEQNARDLAMYRALKRQFGEET